MAKVVAATILPLDAVMGDDTEVGAFIARWRDTGGPELANTQSFITGSGTGDAYNDHAFERRVFQDDGADTVRPVLDALAGVGLARRLTDGRYAA